MHEADAIMALNPQERADMTWHYGAEPGKVCVVPAGVDTALFAPGDRAVARAVVGIPQDEPAILFVGRIDPIKGLDILVDALCGLRSAEWSPAPPRLYLIGGGPRDPGYPALIAQAAERGITDAITFVGSVPHTDLLPWFRAADVVAVPSFYESFGLVAVEAMASGTPVVASNVGGLAFTIEDGVSGLLVPPKDPEALALALRRVLTDSPLHDTLAAGAANAASRFGWPTVTDRVLHIYDRLIRGYRYDLCGADPRTVGAGRGGRGLTRRGA